MHSYFQRRQQSVFLVVPIPGTVITVLGPRIFHNSHKITFPLLFFFKAPHSSPWGLNIQIRVFDFCFLNINKKPHVASAGVLYTSYLDSRMPNFILLAINLLFYYVSLLNSLFLCSECGVALNEREQALMCRLNGCCTRRARCSEGEPGLMERQWRHQPTSPKTTLDVGSMKILRYLNHHLGKIYKGRSSICFFFFWSFQEIAQLRGGVF